MATVGSLLSPQVRATIPISYTYPLLVSQATSGEIPAEDVQNEWINWVREEIDRQAGMCFQAQDFRDELNGNGLSTIFSRCFPLIEVFTLEIDGKIIPKTAYAVNIRTGSVTLRDMRFPLGLQNVVVTGIHGYRVVPPLVQKIATLMVAKTALRAKCGSLVDSESIGGFNQSRSLKKINDELDRVWAALGKRFDLGFI